MNASRKSRLKIEFPMQRHEVGSKAVHRFGPGHREARPFIERAGRLVTFVGPQLDLLVTSLSRKLYGIVQQFPPQACPAGIGMQEQKPQLGGIVVDVVIVITYSSQYTNEFGTLRAVSVASYEIWA